MHTAATTTSRRTATREKRRQQLINATMKCIARKGMSNITLSDVAREAGLSAGIVNLHFESKDNLLNETLRYLADEYRAKFDKTLQRAGPVPTEKLRAVMALNFKPSICNQQKLAVWFAFWGEVKSQPVYRKICDELDSYYDDVISQLCAEIVSDGGYQGASPAVVTKALTSMTDGLWLTCLISPKSWNRKHAMAVIMSYLTSVFPRHFQK